MKIALAQIHVRLGDIEGACERIERQIAVAAAQGAHVLCTPAPLFAGVLPGTLVDYPNYEHDLLAALQRLAEVAARFDVVCLVPALVPLDGGPLFEVFVLRKGRVVPARLTTVQHRSDSPQQLWAPPVFELADMRVAVTFDVFRDITELPSGCDVLVYFQVNGFDRTDEATAAVAAVSDGRYRDEVARASLWLACMAPVGGYDEAAYTGGSFVMDDAGRVVAAAPCFEEALLVQEIRRGVSTSALEGHELPTYQRETWTWEALRLHLRDSMAAAGATRAMVPLAGDMQSALLAALAVDALGSRNVLGLAVGHADALTPDAEARERERMERARELASRLHIRLLEREAGDLNSLLDRDVPTWQHAGCQREIEALYLADAAREQQAFPLSAATKTEYALCPDALLARDAGRLAPFGDVYLTALEFIARARSGISAALPAELVGLPAVARAMEGIVDDAVMPMRRDALYADRVRSLLAALEPMQVDAALEAHVDRNACFDDIPLAQTAPEATALLLMLVRRGEAARRRLPAAPVVSARSFAERAWPASLAWSDMGLRGAERMRAADLAMAEYRRLEEHAARRGVEARGEVLGLLGNLLGLSPEQMNAFASEEGQRRMRAEMQQLEERLQGSMGRHPDVGEGASGELPPGMPPSGFSFFSRN